MNLSDLSIRRPVLATVLNLLIVLIGLGSYGRLPVREYPDVDNPVVSVTTIYTGANAQTVENSITEPLEQALNGIDGIDTIDSTSAAGTSVINIEFDTGRDIDAATTDVTNAVQTALGDIPTDAERPVVRKSSTASRALMWLSVQGENFSPPELTDVADRIVKTPLQVLPGVASIIIGGQRKYAMRIWLDPDRMAAQRVDPQDVFRAITANNLQLPAGVIEGGTRKFSVLADAQMADPHVFGSVTVRREGDRIVRLRDIAEVELGSDNYNTVTRFKSEPIIGVGIVRQSRANELAVSEAVRKALPAIEAHLPEGVSIDVAVDNSLFVRASLKEVWETLLIAFVLVVLVNYTFLRSIPTTVIPSLAIPTSVIGTFAVMYAAGFSINVLTLLGLVLAIGLLVDDAIVVMENVYRHRELGEERMNAARRGTKEVFMPVIATTVSLVAVLIPLSVLTTKTGRLFREFSLTVTFSVIISTFVALTLVPMLCSRFLTTGVSQGSFAQLVERVLNAMGRVYERALEWSMAHRRAVVVFLLANVVLSGVLLAFLPKTLVPTEDRGQFLTILRAPRGSTLAYTDQTLRQVEAEVAQIPQIQGYFAAIGLAIGGPASTSTGFLYGRLRPWDERDVKQQVIVASLFPKLMGKPGALAFPINLPSLGQGRSSDVDVVIRSSTASLPQFEEVANNVKGRLSRVPGLFNVDTDLQVDNPQLDVVFDRDRIADAGLDVEDVARSLQILLAEGKANEFVLRNKQYDVIASLAPRYRATPQQIGQVHLRNVRGEMVPLAGLVRIAPTTAPAEIKHYDLERAVGLTASLAPGFALGDALDSLRQIMSEELPKGFTTALVGTSREFAESSATLYWTFIFAIVFIYLVLAAQFESFIHPLTILLSVPMALLGAFLTLDGLYWFGKLVGILHWNEVIAFDFSVYTFNLYSQIGIILLIGLVTKNSILIVEYANQARARGMAEFDAVLEAGKIRFRPILMTSATSILGAIPLVVASGAGAESRHPIGAAVVGGLTFSTIFTLVVVPVVYLLLVRLAERFGIETIPPALELPGAEPAEKPATRQVRSA